MTDANKSVVRNKFIQWCASQSFPGIEAWEDAYYSEELENRGDNPFYVSSEIRNDGDVLVFHGSRREYIDDLRFAALMIDDCYERTVRWGS